MLQSTARAVNGFRSLEQISCGADGRGGHKVLLPSGLTYTGWGQPELGCEGGGCKGGISSMASIGEAVEAPCPLLDGVWALLPGRSTLGLSMCSGKLDLKCHPVKWQASGLKALGLWDLSSSGETRWGGKGNTASSLFLHEAWRAWHGTLRSPC